MNPATHPNEYADLLLEFGDNNRAAAFEPGDKIPVSDFDYAFPKVVLRLSTAKYETMEEACERAEQLMGAQAYAPAKCMRTARFWCFWIC